MISVSIFLDGTYFLNNSDTLNVTVIVRYPSRRRTTMGNSIVRDVTFARIALMICDIISVIQQFTVMYMTVQGAPLSS